MTRNKQAFIDAVVKASSKGGTVPLTLNELRSSQYCLPLKNLSLQHLFCASGIRFGSVYMIQGPPMSNKSAFMFFLLRLMAANFEDGGLDGFSFLRELETKISPTLLESFIDKPYMMEGDAAPFHVYRELTLEGCLKTFSDYLKKYSDTVPDRDIPLAWGFDSIGGAATEEGLQQMEENGSQGRGFSTKAITLKNFFETYSAFTADIPLITFCVNHEKKPMATPGGPMVPAYARGQATGGDSQKFKASQNFRLSGQDMPNKLGRKISIVTYKNSFGSERKIQVDFTWQVPTAEDPRQYHKWHFAKASADLLASPPTGTATAIRDVCNVTYASDGKRINCPQLGISMGQPEELDQALMENENVLTGVQHILGIEKIQSFDEYLEAKQVKAEQQKATKKALKKAAKQEAPTAPNMLDTMLGEKK